MGSSDVGGRSRIERLQELTSALSRAPTVKAVTGVVMTAITEELGAGAALVALLEGDEAASFTVVDAVGYLPETLDQWGSFPLDAPLPAGDALRQRAMVVLESLAERDRRYPLLKGMPASHESWAIVPLVADDEPIGIVSFGFAGPRRLEPADREFVQAVADQCAQALHRARLFDQQRAVARQRGFLNRAGEAFAEAGSYDEALQLVVELAAPAMADAAALYAAVPGGLRLAGTRSADPAAGRALDHVGSPGAFSTHPLLERVYRTGRAATLDGEAALGGRLLALPLQSRTTDIGVLVLVAREGRRFGGSEWSFAESYCSLAALHCDNARLLEEQTRIAQRLQSSLLPPMLPQIAGIDVAATYVAAGSGAEVGGDFYDVFAAGDGRWFAVTGDVRGRGVEAAVTTGLARHTIRAAAMPQAEPSAVVRRLNDVLLAREPSGWEPRFCAVCVLAVAPTEHGATVTVCCAGHPLPWLVRRDGKVREVGRPGTVAGVVPDPGIVDEMIRLRPGDTLVSFTDGVSERRRDGEFFEDHVPHVLAASAALDVSALAEELRDRAAAFAPGEPNDDLAVLVLRIASTDVEGEGGNSREAAVLSGDRDAAVSAGVSGTDADASEADTYRVVLVDDDPDIRTLARRHLNRSPRFTVVAEARSADEAVAEAERQRPDVTLLDLRMPGGDGFTALPRIRQVAPDCTVVVLSGLERGDVEEEALAAGAVGFLRKQASWDRLPGDLLHLLEGAGAFVPRDTRLELPRSRTSSRRARAFLRRTLPRWGADALLDDAELLTTELVNNAVLHATSEVVLRLRFDEDRLRVEVRDTGGGTLHRQEGRVDATGGRGLLLVDALSDTWGTSAGNDGKVVWFELDAGSGGGNGGATASLLERR